MQDPLIYVAGDVHLRDASGPFMGFLRMLHKRQPARLVILGDLFEYWLETDRCMQRYQAVFDQLRLLREQGWQLDFVLGNRELSSGERLRLACKVDTHWPHLDLQLHGKQIRIVHGDRLCHDPSYHLMAALLRGFWSRAFHLSMPASVHHHLAQLGRSLSKGTPQTPSAKRRLNKVFIDPRRVAAHKRHADIVIAGHIHRVMHKQVRGIELLVVGDWQGRHGHWIEISAAGRCQMRDAQFTT